MSVLESPRLLGSLVLLGWGGHAAVHLARGTTAALLWCCNVGAVLVGTGLLARRPRLAGTGLLWVALGTPLWLLSASQGRELLPTSFLTHFGALAAGLLAGAAALPERSWRPALGGLFALHLLSHLLVPAGRSVNLTGESLGRPPFGHATLIALCTLAACLVLPALEAGLRAAVRGRPLSTAARAASAASETRRRPAS